MCLPYVEGLSENIRRVLWKVGIRVAFKAMSWKGTMMEGVKDKLDEGKRSGVVYEIVCGSCNKSYIGETGKKCGNTCEGTFRSGEKWSSGALGCGGACTGRT